jgi:CBS domain-containing protein
MKIRDIMSEPVDSIDSTNTIADAARRMAEADLGALPILSDGKLVGIVTDRDIAVRGVAAGISANALIPRVMSENVDTCSPEDHIETVLTLMSREQIRRMPVCDREKVVGIVTLADLAEHGPDKKQVAETLTDICKPSGLHSQTPVFA